MSKPEIGSGLLELYSNVLVFELSERQAAWHLSLRYIDKTATAAQDG